MVCLIELAFIQRAGSASQINCILLNNYSGLKLTMQTQSKSCGHIYLNVCMCMNIGQCVMDKFVRAWNGFNKNERS